MSSLSRKGVKCCYISGEQDDEKMKEGVKNGLYSLVYFTPEMILNSRRWRQMLLNEVYCSKHVCLLLMKHTQ